MSRRARRAAPAAPRAIVYTRVSTEQQADHGHSLALQRDKCKAYALALDIDVVDVVEDAGVSAKTLDRPGLQRVLAMLDSGKADTVIVTKLDRLTRRVADLGDLVDRYFAEGCALLSVGDNVDTRTAAGRLVLNVLGSVSQWEREVIAERTREVTHHMQREGRFIGGRTPYGFARDDAGKLTPNKHEQRVIARARELHARGLTPTPIAEQLTIEGFVARNGAPFVAMQVARMCASAERAA